MSVLIPNLSFTMLKKVFFSSVAAIVLLLMGFFAWIFLSVRVAPKYSVPNPNGYDTLRHAGSQLTLIPEDYSTTADAEVLRQYLEINSEAEQLIDEAAEQEFLVITDSVPLQTIYDDIGPVRAAQRLLVARARLAEMEGDLETQMKTYAKLWRISNRCSRGGLIVQQQVAAASEEMAIDQLKGMVMANRLTTQQASDLHAELTKTPRHTLNLDDILATEEAMLRQENGTITTAMMNMTVGNALLNEAAKKTQVKEDQLAVSFQELLGRLTQYDPGQEPSE